MDRRAGLYLRVSTDAQREEGHSIEAQRQMLEGYCLAHGIRDYEFYIDGGFSGSHTDRPALKRLLDDVRAGAVGHVIVYKLDRLSRSQKDTLTIIEDILNPHNAAFTSINEHMDTATPMGRLMLGILSAFAQLERENIRERTRMGMRERVKSGLWMGGGRVPFGYDYDPAQGILVPNADADTVRQVYSLYLQGWSPRRIAQALGLRYERLALQILKRKSNAGFICYNGEQYQGLHEPLVSPETYEQAMALYRARGGREPGESRHLLAGLLVCGHCGAKLRYQKWGRAGCKLVCYSTDPSKPHLVRDPDCPNPKVWAQEIEDAVLGDLFSFALDRDATQPAAPEQDVLAVLRSRLAAQDTRLKRLYTLYAQEENELLRETIGEHLRERGRLQEQLASEEESHRQGKAVAQTRRELKRLSGVWEELDLREKRGVLRALVRRVVVTDGNVHIDYTF